MKKRLIKILSILICVLISGCSLSASQTQDKATDDPPVVLETASPTLLSTIQPSEPPTQEVLNPVTGNDTPLPEATELPTEVVHVTVPGEPKYVNDQKVTDCNTGERKSLGATTLIGVGCDNWSKADLERPADMPNGNYLPAVDIVRAQMGASQEWIFGKVVLYDDASGQIPVELSVMFEIDTDLDSRGDYLIYATVLTSTEWTTNGVQVWWDQTGDVGGEKPHVPDGKIGDGYETLVFDAGVGVDPDLAWVRIDPKNGSIIEFAFKSNLVPENQIFAWWAWTVLGNLEPVYMEIVDSLADTSSWQMDNTCSWIFNGRPSNMIVNICDFVSPTAAPKPTSTPLPSSPNSPSPCVEPPGGCSALGPGWIFYKCECTLFN